MRLAILSDIHANAAALEACLAQARAQRVDRHIFLGDFVGYGPDPAAVIERVAAIADAICIMGNHDWAATGHSAAMNSSARAALDWTRGQLSAAHLQFLSSLPMEYVDAALHCVHADASAPAAWNYVTGTESARYCLAAAKAPVVFCGHVHVPALYCTSVPGRVVSHQPDENTVLPLLPSRTWLAVAGAVGQPRDGNPAAAFCIYDTGLRQLHYCRAPYDTDAVARKMLAAGLPAKLAARLHEGH